MAAITTAAVGVASAGYKIYQGAQTKKKGEQAYNNFERQDLVNPYENIQISTVGSDAMREEAGITTASLVDSARNGGARGIFSSIPKIVELSNRANIEARSYLDDQAIKRDYAIAGDDTNIRSIQEGRDNSELEGIGNMIEVGRQDMWSGIRGMGSAAMYAANNVDFGRANIKPIGGSLRTAGINTGYTPPKPYADLPKLKGY